MKVALVALIVSGLVVALVKYLRECFFEHTVLSLTDRVGQHGISVTREVFDRWLIKEIYGVYFTKLQKGDLLFSEVPVATVLNLVSVASLPFEIDGGDEYQVLRYLYGIEVSVGVWGSSMLCKVKLDRLYLERLYAKWASVTS